MDMINYMMAKLNYLNADWSNKIYCADKLQDMLIETDGLIVILGNNGFYRYDKNLELKSYSNFSVQGTRCHALAKSNFVKEKDNEFSFLAFDLDKMYQVTYKYFGHDCLTQMYGNVFTIQNIFLSQHLVIICSLIH